MRTIRVYGQLARKLGQRVFRAEVDTIAEAVRFLVANFPHIEEHMIQQYYKVRVGKHIIEKEGIHYPIGKDENIFITPVIVGAGSLGRIIAGVFLIAASFLIPGAQLFGYALAPIVFGIGASLVLGGVAQLLAPTPQTPKKDKDPKETSYSFSGIQNTSRSGLPIPIIYGETVVGSIVISAGVSVEVVD